MNIQIWISTCFFYNMNQRLQIKEMVENITDMCISCDGPGEQRKAVGTDLSALDGWRQKWLIPSTIWQVLFSSSPSYSQGAWSSDKLETVWVDGRAGGEAQTTWAQGPCASDSITLPPKYLAASWGKRGHSPIHTPNSSVRSVPESGENRVVCKIHRSLNCINETLPNYPGERADMSYQYICFSLYHSL